MNRPQKEGRESFMDTTRKFDGYAGDYTAGRPSYATELINCLYDRYGISESSVIADIGSGTGKFAKHLLEKGSEVYCVEPNDDMRKVAESELGGYVNFHSVNGNAEHTELENSSVDFITTAQAFHWFDVRRFRQECSRIIKNSGKIFLIWNMRDEDDVLNQEMHRINTRYCPDFKGFNGGIKKDDRRIRDFFNDNYDFVSFEHPLYLDKDKFISRSLSGSYSLKKGDREFEQYMAEIEDVFCRHSDQGIVCIGNNSVAYEGSVK